MKGSILFLAATFLSIGSVSGQANTQVTSSTSKDTSQSEAEIVLTVEELESLLTKIAERRKAVLAERNAGAATLGELNLGFPAGQRMPAPNMEQQLALLNLKLDWLLSNGLVNPSNPAGQGVVLNLLNQSDALPGGGYGYGYGYGPGLTVVPGVTGVNGLAQQTQPNASLHYSDSVRGIDSLGRIATAGDQSGLPVGAQGQHALSNDRFKQYTPTWGREVIYGHSIYFDHNSTKISNSYNKELDQIASLLLQRQEEAMLILKGFASQVGNAFYNNQLSFNRADAVKSYLMKKGVPASRILILHHGADPSMADKEARRVDVIIEISKVHTR